MDIIEIDRLKTVLCNDENGIISETFTSGEITFCKSKKDEAEAYAGLFAAKEAFLKALGTGWRYGITWREIEVKQEGRKFTITTSGEANSKCLQNQIKNIYLSINTTKQTATAVVILEK